jgi:hypothetical protein
MSYMRNATNVGAGVAECKQETFSITWLRYVYISDQ